MDLAKAHVRPATEADLPRLLELLQQLSLDTPRERVTSPPPQTYQRAFQQISADERQQLFVVEDGGRVVGTACLIIVPNLSHEGRPYALLENVVVDATERSAGYGELLMRHAISKAQRAGCYKLALTSNKRRPDAHRFYQRLGFRATSEGFRIDF